MTLNPDQQKALEVASLPLIEFLRANCHPHCQVIVDVERAELVEGIAATRPLPLTVVDCYAPSVLRPHA